MHAKTSYQPHVDEFVYLRQAFRFVVAQVTALNHAKAEVVYTIPEDGRIVRKWVALRMLAPYTEAVKAVDE